MVGFCIYIGGEEWWSFLTLGSSSFLNILPFPVQGFWHNLLLMLFSVFKGKYEQMYEQSEEFQQELKLKVREILTQQEWRRRKMQMRVCWKLCYFLVSIGCFHFWLHILMIFLPFSSCRYRKRKVDWRRMKKKQKRCGRESVSMRSSGKEQESRGFVSISLF